MSTAIALLTAAGPAMTSGWPDVATPLPPTGLGVEDAAVVVAIEDYLYLPDIPGARANASAWVRWLVSVHGVPAAAVFQRLDAAATDDGIRDALRRGAAQVGPGGTLWVVFVGHGAPVGSSGLAQLVGVDATRTVDGIAARSVPRSEVVGLAAGSHSGAAVVFLDACFSGYSSGGEPLLEGIQPVVPEEVLTETGSVTVLSAASAEEFAGPLPGSARPAFSYLALGALRGWADSDADGSVSASEVARYGAGALNLTLAGRTQTPGLAGPDRVLSRAGEAGPDLLLLADANRGTSGGAPARVADTRDPGPGRRVTVGLRGGYAGMPMPGFPGAGTGLHAGARLGDSAWELGGELNSVSVRRSYSDSEREALAAISGMSPEDIPSVSWNTILGASLGTTWSAGGDHVEGGLGFGVTAYAYNSSFDLAVGPRASARARWWFVPALALDVSASTDLSYAPGFSDTQPGMGDVQIIPAAGLGLTAGW